MIKNFKFLFASYLSFLFIVAAYILFSLHNDTTNSMSEWVINYQGGFTRRGFLGEIIFQLSMLLDFELRSGFLILQITTYFLYFFSLFYFFKNIKTNYIFLLAIFSPIFFLFSLAELEALGRKDILMFSVFLINFIIYEKYNNPNLNYIYFLFTFPIVFLTHEIYIIYLPYLFFFFIVIEKNLNFKFFLKISILIFYIIFFLYLINNINFSAENLNLLCKNLLEKKNEACGLAPHSMIVDLSAYRSEVGWKATHISRYLLFFLIGSGGLILSIYYSTFNLKKVNFFVNKFNFKILFIIIALPSVLPFLTAVDSGRYLSMAYTMPCITFFSLYKLRIILVDFDKMKKDLALLIPKNKRLRIFFFILVCFTWSPKAVYHEDTASLPIYRLIEKIPNFYPNFINEIKKINK